jgi:hypothetical protein
MNLARVASLAARFAPRAVPSEIVEATDPCREDLNRDGVTDPRDVAFACQVVIGGQPAAPPLEVSDEDPADTRFTESECDEYCLRA